MTSGGDGRPSDRSSGHEAHATPPAMTAPTRWASLWGLARGVLQIGLPALVIWLVWRELHSLNFHTVRATLLEANGWLMFAGVVVSFGAVGVMGLYDAFAFPSGASGTLGFRRRWALGAVLFGWTNFVSMGPFGGPAIRLLAYRRVGLTGPEITRGLMGHYVGSSAGLAAWLVAAWLPIGTGGLALGARLAIALGGAVLLSVGAGRIMVPILRRHRYGSELEGMSLAQLGAVSFFDWGLTLVAFELLIRSVGVQIDPAGAARTVFTGHFAGLASMIPGGLGSADAVWFRGFDLLGVGRDGALAGILAFRVGFYVLPWVASLIVLYTALAMRSARLRRWQRRVVAGAVMLNAILLLLSAATPAVRDRLDAVARLVPLGAIEVSHALATVAAALMLLLVRGLLRGYRSAYVLTVGMLIASAIAHPLKGGDVEEGLASVVLLILLFGVRGAFTRQGRVPVGWELTLAGGLGALSLFLVAGFATFERIPYRQELWTTFAERAQASRFLRAAILLGGVVLLAAARQAMRPARLWVTPTPDETTRAEAFVRAHAGSAAPLLVGGGDKGVWFFEGPGGGLVLYQRHGDKIVVFKDPVLAPEADAKGLIQAFLQFADDLDVDVVFSMISPEWMSRLHEFGFHFLKVNEEAIVSLEGFTLQGGKNTRFRRIIREMEKAGIRFEIMKPPFDEATIERLRLVSDTWLAAKGGHELQFSACCFSPAYVQRNPIGVARDGSGQIIAFVNILFTRPGGPATLDFMRYVPDIADNLMDFVIIRVMQELAAWGATSFSLGGAPLSDVGVFRGSRLAERMLHVFSKRAERVFNYQGLLKYKSKFHPAWEARYLAFQQPWDWASSLLANARLVDARGRADRARIAAARVDGGSAGRVTE